MIALFIVPIVLVAFVSFYLGKSQERAEWNKLIKDGILPKLKQQEQ
jgi:Tfp pilus assembly protein PilW